MACLIAMAVYDPPGEPRTELFEKCITSLWQTCCAGPGDRHRLVLIDNGSCERTRWILNKIESGELHGPGALWSYPPATIIRNETNLGTARAINKAWALRRPGEHCAKIDSDIIFNDSGWLDKLEEALSQDPKLGLLCLKRRDCIESPHNAPGQWSHSRLIQLPHKPGERWHYVERVQHAMGSAQLYRSELLDKIGYLYQMGGQYGFDDSLAAARCEAAGFYSAFYCNVDIDHPDPGGTEYQKWKERYSGERMDAYLKLRDEYLSGKRPVWHGPEDE